MFVFSCFSFFADNRHWTTTVANPVHCSRMKCLSAHTMRRRRSSVLRLRFLVALMLIATVSMVLLANSLGRTERRMTSGYFSQNKTSTTTMEALREERFCSVVRSAQDNMHFHQKDASVSLPDGTSKACLRSLTTVLQRWKTVHDNVNRRKQVKNRSHLLGV